MARGAVVRVRTRRDVERWLFALVGLVAAVQILLTAVEPFLGRSALLFIRLMGAAFVAAGSIIFEKYKARRFKS